MNPHSHDPSNGPSQPSTGQPVADQLTDHQYDGIQEYDNPTPGWWNWLFIATIVFSLGYFFIHHAVSDGAFSPQAEYDRAVAEQLKAQFASGPLKADAATLMNLCKDKSMKAMGESIFITNCASCHNRDGSGIVGPNLTDDYYIEVKQITDIPDVVTKGRLNGAMPAWGNRLSPNEIVVVASYVAQLRGQNKPGKPVEPNAKKIEPWSEHSVAAEKSAQAPADDDPTKRPMTLSRDGHAMMGYLKDPAILDAGKQLFTTYGCYACHGTDANGGNTDDKGKFLPLAGPNLTDDFYINVRKLTDIPVFVTNGSKKTDPTKKFPDGSDGMPEWGALMAPDDITRVSIYVASLRGLNKPGKPAEGQKLAPWSE